MPCTYPNCDCAIAVEGATGPLPDTVCPRPLITGEEPNRCPTCGEPVTSIFDHVDGCPGDEDVD